jgi:hypothetical protein
VCVASERAGSVTDAASRGRSGIKGKLTIVVVMGMKGTRFLDRREAGRVSFKVVVRAE